MIKAVITADNHLNAYYSKMPYGKLEKRREYIRLAFQKTIDFAIDNKVNLYLHAGDLFDMPNPKNSEIIFVAEQLSRLKDNKIKIYMVSGTHDVSKLGYDTTVQKIFQVAKFAFLFPQDKLIEKNYKFLTITGLSYDPQLSDSPLNIYKLKNNQTYTTTVLLVHLGIEGYIYPLVKEPIISLDSLSKSGVDILIAGHQHNSNFFKAGEKYVLIPGATERFDFGEVNNTPGFYYLELEEPKKLKKIEKINISAQPMEVILINIEESAENDDINSLIINRIKEKSAKDKLLKCKLKGMINIEQFHKIKYREIFLIGTDLNFYFDLDTRELFVREETTIFSDTFQKKGSRVISIKAQIQQETENLMKSVKDEEEKDILKSAQELIINKLNL